ncbi:MULTISPECIES: helix-turn-helix transcriptional regulator [unclassified Kribbella]|uniref:helix-turn-helix transcriptional regulator n=1 Tax=unclassified Kribbella TaxID=2644121 RepID=UPI003018F902
MKTYHAESARAGLEAAADAGLAWDDFCRVTAELLERAIPHDSICIGTADPATNLLTGAVLLDMEHADENEFVQYEYGVPDFNHYIDLARRPVSVSILAEATEGRPDRSRRYREYLSKVDLPHEMRGVIRSGDRMWGVCTLYRTSGRTGFSPAEADFVNRLEPILARGLRRGLIAGEVRQKQQRAATAVLILDGADRVISATEAAEERIKELGGELWSRLPLPVATVVAAARRVPALADRLPEMRIRTRNGEWLTVNAAPVRGRDGLTTDIAVTIETAGAADIIPLVVAAYGLTDRERTVVQQVLGGASTTEIAQRLHLSPYTIQDHLKAIFEKVGVSSRRELSSRIFFGHYAGRLGQDLDANGWFSED